MTTVKLVTHLVPWATLITAIAAGFIAFRSQIRLKAFELLLQRRTEVLGKIENQIESYRYILDELASDASDHPNLDRWKHSEFHNALILFHQAKGLALGPLATTLMDTYWSIHSEIFNRTFDSESLKSHLERKLNALAAFYGFAHSEMSREIEAASASSLALMARTLGYRKKLKAVRTEPSRK